VGELAYAPRLSVVPPHPRYAENALFEARLATKNIQAGRHPPVPNLHWMDYCVAFRDKARPANLTVATADMLAVDDADVLMVMGVPVSPRRTRRLRAQRPDLVIILVTLAWDQGWCLDPNRFKWGQSDIPVTGVPFFDERCGVKFKDISEFPERLSEIFGSSSPGKIRSARLCTGIFDIGKCSTDFVQIINQSRGVGSR
jgi:hypothetical protein